MTNLERRDHLRRALKAFHGYSNTPMGILGHMPSGVDDDIWKMAEAFENMLENRIKEVESLDWDAEAPVK